MSTTNIDESDILSYIILMTYKRIYINAKSLIDFLGGATNLTHLFKKYNFEPINRNTIYKWTERGVIPVERYLQIEHMAIKEGTYVEMRKRCIVIFKPSQ